MRRELWEGELYSYVHGEEGDSSKENADEVFRCTAARTISIIQDDQKGLEGLYAFCREIVSPLITRHRF